ncbi:MAG: NAD-dependent epimerase [Acidaminobacteraceae bacterium]
MKILVTGAAGFIGYHLSSRLLKEGFDVIGYDNVNDYYDVKLKYSRLKILNENSNFNFYKNDLEDYAALSKVFLDQKIDVVINLAAQAGVRYSIENPKAYIESNIVGFLNILEVCRNNDVKHLLYASSSSVYGGNKNYPFSVKDNVDHPISLYAATKKSNELMAHTYSHLYNLPTTGLRFFTVYGPYGRPDMALFLFTDAIINNRPIKVFNEGKMLRDFTYVEDIVEGIYRLIEKVPTRILNEEGSSDAPYKLYNIGNNNPVELERFIEIIEEKIGKKALKEYLPLQPGDVPKTYANIDELIEAIGYAPQTSIGTGIENFIKWYLDYYNVEIME